MSKDAIKAFSDMMGGVDMIGVITNVMDETKEQTEQRRKENAERREEYNSERDQDLEPKRDDFKGVSRRNDAWDMNESDYL